MSVNQYVERPKTIEAIQFDGSVDGIKEIQRYLELDYIGIDWKDDFPRLKISNRTIKKGDYVIKNIQRGIEVMSEKEFKNTFDNFIDERIKNFVVN